MNNSQGAQRLDKSERAAIKIAHFKIATKKGLAILKSLFVAAGDHEPHVLYGWARDHVVKIEKKTAIFVEKKIPEMTVAMKAMGSDAFKPRRDRFDDFFRHCSVAARAFKREPPAVAQ